MGQKVELGTDFRGLACQAEACRHFNRKPWNIFDLGLDMHRPVLNQDKFDSKLWNRLGKRDQRWEGLS